MRRFLKVSLQIICAIGFVYGVPGVTAVLAELSKSSYARYIQAASALALVIFILWWNRGHPRIGIQGMPWRSMLYFPKDHSRSLSTAAAFVGFVNKTSGRDSDAIGKNIVGQVTFFTKNWQVIHTTSGVWSMGGDIDGRKVNLYPGDKVDLHVAVGVNNQMYAVDPLSYAYPADTFRNNGPELKEDRYMVKVVLIGEGVSQTFWFDLHNFAKNPDVLGFYAKSRFASPRVHAWYFLKVEPWLEKQLPIWQEKHAAMVKRQQEKQSADSTKKKK